MRLAGEPITGFESAKVRALLVYLAVEADRPHRRDSLAALLWPDWPDRAARGNLRRALSNLRKTIGDHRSTPPFLLVTRDTVQFNTPSDHFLDVAALGAPERANQQSGGTPSQGPGEDAVGQWEAAVALYRGPFLEGFYVKDCPEFEDWTRLWRERLHRQVTTLLRRLVEHYEQRGEYQRACESARRQLELEPWHEEAHRQLMRELALGGERSAALAQYEECRRLLARELDVEPSEQTTQLYALIRDGRLEPPAQTPPSVPAPLHNLPVSLTPFVGRRMELREIRQLLQDPACRLLTLTGPGGSGKTRLAVEAAGAQVDGFQHGVWFVPLAAVQSPEGIVLAIGQALGFGFAAGDEPQQQLLDHLHSKQTLLILDNFDQLVVGGSIVVDLLETVPDSKIVITSRTRLLVQGEQVFLVGGMEYPQLPSRPGRGAGRESAVSVASEAKDLAQYSAVQLFCQAAARVRAGFEPSAAELSHVAGICALVEGMPLGILLAAAWVDVLSPAAIEAEIESSLDFLQAEWHDLPDRQRSMRAVFDRSWSLLGQEERQIVQKLSVFRGGLTRQAAEAVAGASLHQLQALVQKSLLQYRPAPSTSPLGEARYEIHELLRQYAAEKLAESHSAWEAACERHCAHYLGAMQCWANELKGPRQRTVLLEMEADIDNIHSAWQWAREHRQIARLTEAMEGLQLFYWRRGRYLEGEAAMREATGSLGTAADAWDQLRLQARASIWQSEFCYVLGRREQAAELLQGAQALLDTPPMTDQDTRFERALLLMAMGRAAWWSDQQRSSQLLKQALRLLRELDDTWRVAEVLAPLGRWAVFSDSVDQGERWLQESVALYRSLGDDIGCATSMAYLSNAALGSGRLEEAEALARQAAQISLERGSRADHMDTLGILGYLLMAIGKYGEAHEVAEECIRIRQGQEARYHIAHARSTLSGVSLHLGDYVQAKVHAETTLADARETGVRHSEGHALFVLGCIALAQGKLDEAGAFAQESAQVFREWGCEYYAAPPETVLSAVARALDRPREARQHLVAALRLSTDRGRVRDVLWALPMAALLLADEGEGERAVELYALAERHPRVANSRWFEDVAGRHITAVAASLPPDVAASARERAQARSLGEAAVDLLAELREKLAQFRHDAA